MKVLCIGQITYDITFYNDRYPIENTKLKSTQKNESPGGCAFNMTALLTKWGIDTSLVSVIGNDMYGSELLNAFHANEIKDEYVQKNNGHTTIGAVTCNSTNNTRTIHLYHDPDLKINDVNVSFNPDLIISDGYYKDTFIEMIRKFPAAITMLDAGRCNQETIEMAKLVKYLVCSKDFAEDFTNMTLDLNDKTSIINIFNNLNTNFPGTTVITLEKFGSIINLNNELYLIPSVNVDCVDTNGAGDIYHGAFAYGLTQNWPLAKIMKIANISGALSTKKRGSYESIPNLDEVLSYVQE